MWEWLLDYTEWVWLWFSVYSIWIFIAGSLLLFLLLFLKSKAWNFFGCANETRKSVKSTVLDILFWVLEGIILVIVASSLVALVLYNEGIAGRLTPQMVEEWFLDHGIGVLWVILAGVVLWYLWRKVVNAMLARYLLRPKRGESREGMKRRADTLRGIFMGTGRVVIFILVLFMVLSELNVPIGPVLAGFGIAGIAVGFGAQYLIRDLIAGIFILFENQYRVGDVARVADISGLVEEVTLRKTVLRDLDGIVHHVPNGEIKVASNYSRHFARINLDISVSYGTDLDYAIAVINQVCREMAEAPDWKDRIRVAPQVLRVNKLGDSGIDIKVLGEVKPLEQWAAMGELRLRIKKAFDKVGIEIPWPHTKVYFGNSPNGKE